MLERQKRLNFLLEMQSSATVNYCTLLSATTDSLQPFYMGHYNTVCSLFRYFAIILFSAYRVNRQISVRFSWKFALFFHVVPIETVYISLISKVYFFNKNS